MAGCGADTDANVLIGTLTQDASFPIPDVDFSTIVFPDGVLDRTIESPTVEDITTGDIEGKGVFDALMRGFKAHLEKEFENNRITGNDYTKAYIALTESAMSQGIAFLLGKDNSFWQAQLAQLQAFTARLQFEETKIRVAATQYDASNQKATYALTKLRMSSESAAYCTAQFNLSELMPVQRDTLDAERLQKLIQNDIATFNLTDMLPKQADILTAQKTEANTNNQIANYNLANLLPHQLQKLQTDIAAGEATTRISNYNLNTLLPSQNSMLIEQKEAQRAQTQDVRSDGTAVTGVLGKQKELYGQQIISYQRDSELKVAKVFSDSWITQKSIDEGLTPPNSFTNAEIEKVLVQLRQKAGLGI